MEADSFIEILPQTHESFLAGFRLYRTRPDKGYSLTDCILMAAMRPEGLNEVLTNFEPFTQDGRLVPR